MHEDWQDSEGTRGHKYWGMGSEARKMVADHVKAKGGALRDRKTCLNLRLDNGRRHGVYVSMSTPNCVVCMCMFVCVIIGRMEPHTLLQKSCSFMKLSLKRQVDTWMTL